MSLKVDNDDESLTESKFLLSMSSNVKSSLQLNYNDVNTLSSITVKSSLKCEI